MAVKCLIPTAEALYRWEAVHEPLVPIVLFVVLLSPHPTITKSPAAEPVVLPVIPTVSTPHIGDVLLTETIAMKAFSSAPGIPILGD